MEVQDSPRVCNRWCNQCSTRTPIKVRFSYSVVCFMIEADTIEFDKGVSPIEFHRPDDLMEIVERINKKSVGE